MAIRDIIHIDEDKCNGCGACASACVEGAIRMIDGKARLVRDDYCDGLGACLGHCPTGALTIEQREAPDFDEDAVEAFQKQHAAPAPASSPCPGGGCPGTQARTIERAPAPATQTVHPATNEDAPSELGHWPVQLKLIQPSNPVYAGADLLIAADCTAVAYGNFQALLKGKSMVMACPKLDDRAGYIEKLTALFAQAQPRSVTVARMEVPCCGGIVQLVQQARANSGSTIPVTVLTLGIDGTVRSEDTLTTS